VSFSWTYNGFVKSSAYKFIQNSKEKLKSS
jgi:hypothetical protein